ncbi:MAG: S41 family peptidase [bacterium]
MKKYFQIISFLIVITTLQIYAQQEAGLLRFPAIHNDQVVFTYAGDLYTVSSQGGIARKITNGKGVELFPRFSHDGKQIAFTGQYDGNTEVYIMPANGGEPKRITYTATLGRDDVSDRMGPNNLVIGWTHDDKNVLFRSRMIEANDFIGQLFLAPISGDIAKQLPLPRGGFASYSPDDSKLAYNRVFREFRTWKRYRGGMADDIWIYDFKTKETTNLTNDSGQDIIPMWNGNNIYFLSDRDELNRMNLYVCNLDTKEIKKLTDFKDYDIKFPSLGNNAIVFENGGFIYTFDLANGSVKKIVVQFAEDFAISRNGIVDVSKTISNYEISPDGKRALFGARGEVFTVPQKDGVIRNLTNTSGVHERSSKWSPDGKYIAFISDASGEDEIYITLQDGSGKPIQITNSGGAYKYQLNWSPDSKKILYSDRELNIKYVDIESKKVTSVLKAEVGRRLSASWSPDSKWLTYSLPQYDGLNIVYLYSLEKNENYAVTDKWYTSGESLFSNDGKYLIFISSRDFQPVYGWTEWNHIYHDMNGIYLLTLSKDTKSPFEPKSDEVTIKEDIKEESKDSKKETEKKDADKKDEVASIKIDIDGIAERIIKLPAKASNYSSIGSVENKIYYQRRGSDDAATKLLMFDLDKKKETELGEVDGYEISADNKKMLISQGRSYSVIDLPTNKIDASEKLDLSDMKINLNRKEEWKQIFNQACRQFRDFFYVANMHGLDWEATCKKYESLLTYVNSRIDLTYVIGEMIGELNIGHSYTGGGDYPKAERIQTGLLGAKLLRDEGSKFYKIEKILEGANWNSSLRSPLTEIGLNVKEGDFIIAVDGKSTNDMTNIYESLIGKVDKQVKLTINSKPSEDGSRDVVIIPISNEQQLYYYNWVQTNIEKVDKATNGKVGYLHIPDMDVTGLNEFVKHFYPQLRKEALIIDVRGNGGGNVSQMVIDRLTREIVALGNARNNIPDPDPDAAFVGPQVCLLNEFSASDGDIFPFRFKSLGLGKLIGKKSWGGVVGIAGSVPFVDGGYCYVPEFGMIDKEGKNWIIEGKGVEPDIIVDNDPAKEFAGIDEQLNRAIEEVIKELEQMKYKVPKETPPPPEKTK